MVSQERVDPARAIEELRQAVAEFRRFIMELPDEARVEKLCGPKEVLAHLIFWLESYVIQIDSLLAGETPILPQGHFDDLNARAVEASRGVTIIELLDRHQAAGERLAGVAQSYDPDSIILTLKKGSSFRHPLTTYLTAEAEHIRWHQQILERQVRREYLGDLEMLRETVDAFCRFMSALPEAALADQAGGPKGVLAYLVFWHERCVAQIEAILAEAPFTGPEGRLKDLNAQAVEAGRDLPVAELVRRFKSADERLRQFAETLDPQNIVVKMQAHQSTLDGVISGLTTHIRNQQRKLEQAQKRAVPRD